jgi:DNA-binding CsgD family transcriptional regulator
LLHSRSIVVEPLSAAGGVNLIDMVNAIGDDGFECQFAEHLHHEFGADHCSVFRIENEQPSELAAISLDGTDRASQQSALYVAGNYWRRDPSLIAVNRRFGKFSPSLVVLDPRGLDDADFRDAIYTRGHVGERILICGDIGTSRILLSILRSEERGSFSEHEIAELVKTGAMLLTVLGKHADIVRRRPDISSALTCLDEIESCIAVAPLQLPRREAEVCSRILYGLSSIGIALDLGVSEETVMTYRKRAYQRLMIGSQRELLLWYLNLWSQIPKRRMEKSQLH